MSSMNMKKRMPISLYKNLWKWSKNYINKPASAATQTTTRQTTQPLALQVSDSSTIRSAAVDGYINDELVQLVQEHRCLWDTSSRSFKENNMKLEAWKNITEVLGQNG